MTMLADIHCHILPYVDDGAAVEEVSHELLNDLYSQGVRFVCCTPHLRKGMFETPDEEVLRRFSSLKQYADEAFQGDLKLCVSREYHYDLLFREKLREGNVLPLGNGSYLLIEFSSRHSKEEILEAIGQIQACSRKVLVAHAERYEQLRMEDYREIAETGAWLQVNAGSVLGREGFPRRLLVRRLLKAGLVHVVASDAHDPEYRPVELEKAYKTLSFGFGKERAGQWMLGHPRTILEM